MRAKRPLRLPLALFSRLGEPPFPQSFPFWYCIYPYGSTDMEQGRRRLARLLLPTQSVGENTPLCATIVRG